MILQKVGFYGTEKYINSILTIHKPNPNPPNLIDPNPGPTPWIYYVLIR